MLRRGTVLLVSTAPPRAGLAVMVAHITPVVKKEEEREEVRKGKCSECFCSAHLLPSTCPPLVVVCPLTLSSAPSKVTCSTKRR
jgi:hypothetical protein